MTDMTAYYRAYYLEHREHLIELAKMWKRNNRDRINANNRRRYRIDPAYRERKIEEQRVLRERRKADV